MANFLTQVLLAPGVSDVTGSYRCGASVAQRQRRPPAVRLCRGAIYVCVCVCVRVCVCVCVA